MRKILAVLAVLALAGISASAAGGLGLFGSYWDADGDVGMGGGLKLKMEMAPNIALELRGSYLPEWDFDEDETGDAMEDFSVIPVEADLVVNFPLGDMLKIYGGAGGGYYVTPEFESDVAIPGSDEPDVDPEDVFGYFALGGVEIALSEQVSLFAEAQYRWVEFDEVEIDGEDVDVDDADLTGFGANAGLLLTW